MELNFSTTRVRWFLALLAVFLLLFGVSATVFAQGGARGAMTGTVKDSTGAVIPDTTVQIINQGTGVVERTVTTGKDGSFSATLLPVAMYRLVVTAPKTANFAKAEAVGVEVRVAETTPVSIVMKPGGATELVEVSGVAAVVNTVNPTTGTTIGAHTAEDLPLASRNFLTLLALSAGANGEIFDGGQLGRGAVSMNVNGQRPTNNNYQLEGVNVNDINLPIFDNVALPNPDAIQEFKTQTSLYDASQGRNGGGNIQVLLKSGGDKYHGTVYEFERNTALNANSWFNKRDQIYNDGDVDPTLNHQGVFRQHTYGATLGGPVPIGKNWFWFGSYQGAQAVSGTSNFTFFGTNMVVLPTNRSEASLISTFFPTGIPASQANIPGGTAGHLSPVALAFLNLPASNCPGINDGTHCIPTVGGTVGGVGSINRTGAGKYKADEFTVSMDKELTPKDKLTGRVFWDKDNQAQPFATASTLPFPRGLPHGNHFGTAAWTRTLSSNVVNNARFGFSRFHFSQNPQEPISLEDVGATRGNSADFPAVFRIAISGTGGFSLGTGVNDDRGGFFNTFEWSDDLSISHGKHLLRAGGTVSRYQLNRFNNFSVRGSVAFSTTGAGFFDPADPSLTGFQNFLLGRVGGVQGNSGFASFHFRATDYAAYFQDDWKIRPRLTLNLGLRWEGLSVAHEKNNFLTSFANVGDGGTGVVQFIHPEQTEVVGTPGVSSCTLTSCLDMNNFAPRIGFAWNIFGDQKTVVRGGYGMYYQRMSNQSLLQTSGGQPFAQPISVAPNSVPFNDPVPGSLPLSAFPLPTDRSIPPLLAFCDATGHDPSGHFVSCTAGAPLFGNSSGTSSSLTGFLFFPRRDLHAPKAMQWNLGVQREVAKGWMAEIAYVGSRGISLLGPGNASNAAQVCTLAAPCTIPASIGQNVAVAAGTPNVLKNLDGTITINGSTVANADARVNPKYMGLQNDHTLQISNGGSSTYHAMQASVIHQFAAGLYFQAAYTWSKSIDNSSGSSFQDEINGNNPFGDQTSNFRFYRGLSDFDRTHRLTISYNYELPFNRWFGVENHGLGKIVNGWAINGVNTFQSGTPFQITDSSRASLNDPSTANTFDYVAQLIPGTPLGSVVTGTIPDLASLIAGGGLPGQYVDLSKFTEVCVNSQNVTVACGAGTFSSLSGGLGRNVFRGPFQQTWDLSLIKSTKVTERVGVDFRAEVFNILNHPAFASPQFAGAQYGNYGIVDVAAGDSSILNTVNAPRIMQFGLKVVF
jgi:hypothetical protein